MGSLGKRTAALTAAGVMALPLSGCGANNSSTISYVSGNNDVSDDTHYSKEDGEKAREDLKRIVSCGIHLRLPPSI